MNIYIYIYTYIYNITRTRLINITIIYYSKESISIYLLQRVPPKGIPPDEQPRENVSTPHAGMRVCV